MNNSDPTAFAVKTWYGWKIRFVDALNKIPTDRPVVKLYYKPSDYDVVVAERDAYRKIAESYIKQENFNAKEAMAKVPAVRSA